MDILFDWNIIVACRTSYHANGTYDRFNILRCDAFLTEGKEHKWPHAKNNTHLVICFTHQKGIHRTILLLIFLFCTFSKNRFAVNGFCNTIYFVVKTIRLLTIPFPIHTSTSLLFLRVFKIYMDFSPFLYSTIFLPVIQQEKH